MLENPISVRFSTFKVTNGQRKIPLFDRFDIDFAPHTHDAAGRRAHVFPI